MIRRHYQNPPTNLINSAVVLFPSDRLAGVTLENCEITLKNFSMYITQHGGKKVSVTQPMKLYSKEYLQVFLDSEIINCRVLARPKNRFQKISYTEIQHQFLRAKGS